DLALVQAEPVRQEAQGPADAEAAAEALFGALFGLAAAAPDAVATHGERSPGGAPGPTEVHRSPPSRGANRSRGESPAWAKCLTPTSSLAVPSRRANGGRVAWGPATRRDIVESPPTGHGPSPDPEEPPCPRDHATRYSSASPWPSPPVPLWPTS